MTSSRDLPLPDLVASVIDDARQLVEAQVTSLRADLGDRLGDLGSAIRSWLVAVCVAIVTTVMLGLAITATLAQVIGLPWFASLWLVTFVAIAIVAGLVYRARSSGKRVVETKGT